MTIRRRIASSALALALASPLTLAACSTEQAPVTGRSQSMLVSEKDVISESTKSYSELLAKLRKEGKLNADHAEVERVSRVVRKLVPQAIALRPDAAQWQWELNVAETKTINAWCMAGGKMMVYSGLIETLHVTDDELAAVLAHEIAHAIAKHQQERASHEQARQLLTLPFSIAAKVFLPVDPTSAISELAFGLPFSREQESEADRIGLTIMARAGYDPKAMISLFQKMQAQDKGDTPQFMSTHPSDATRIEDIRRTIANDPELQRRA
jgi:predicted Zn-dependent protease